MFAIYVGGDCLQYCEQPHYIKSHTDEETGRTWYIQADGYDDAEAVTVHGTIYSLPFKEPIEGHETEAVIVDKDLGTFIFDDKQKIEATQNDLSETKETVEEALCDVDTEISEWRATFEEALCDIDMLLN